MELQDKVCVITGAARGVGKSTAIKFSKSGATLVIVDILQNDLKTVEELIHDLGGECLAITADLSKSADIEEAVRQTLVQYSQIDILVNNAGIVGPTKKVWEIEETDWDKIFAINLKSVFIFCKLIVPSMIEHRGGKIINLASIAGKEGNDNLAAYSASKAGVQCFSRVLAKEVAPYGIRVNSIAPALIKTDMAGDMPKEQVEFLLQKIPMGRMGEPDEVAELILFLASDRSSFITGQCFNITGGRGDY